MLARFLAWLKYAAKSLIMLPVSMWRWYVNLFKGKPWYKKLALAFFSMVLALFFYIFAVYVNLFWLFGSLPSFDSIMHPKTNEASVIYSSDGLQIGKFFKDENRSNVKYAQVDSMFFTTLIDTEDERFYEHYGVDFAGLAAAFKDMLTGNPRGGSTITQQLAKNMFRVRTDYSNGLLGSVPGLKMLIMKTKEAILATELEMLYSKKEILMMYVNTVDFGSNSFGIHSAAKTYFATTPDQLKVEESAVLVGLLKATNTYNPRVNPDRSLERRNVVLNNLYTHGHLTMAERDSLCALPIDISKFKQERIFEGVAPYLCQEIARELSAKFKERGMEDVDLYADGLKIYTTIDTRMQKYAEDAVLAHMQILQRNFHLAPAIADRYVNSVVRTLPRYKQLKDDPDSLQYYLNVELNRVHEVKVNDPYNGRQTYMMSTRDSIKYMLGFLQAGFVVIEPSSHHIMAWVGNLNFRSWNHDNVIARHQTGSTFKGIVYTEAMQQGWSPCDRVLDKAPRGVKLHKTACSGANMLLRSAFKYSKNGAAVNLCYQLGPKNVVNLARKLGITDELYQDCQNLTLGSSSIKLRDLVNAYSVILADGYMRAPIMVTKVVDRNGDVIYSEESEQTRKVLSYRTSFLMQQMLHAGMEGTSAPLRNFVASHMNTTDFGGKTGTTNESADALYVGAIPNLVGGVWVGGEYRDIHPHGSGASISLPIWGRFISKVLSDSKFEHYQQKFAPCNDAAIEKSCYMCGWGRGYAAAPVVEGDGAEAAGGGGEVAAPAPAQ